jgi:hypothetical protein
VEEVKETHAAASGSWTGCDWTALCGETAVNVAGCTSNEAEFWAEVSTDQDAQDWQLAAQWLKEVELKAAQAQKQGDQAAAAAQAGNFHEALRHAQQACWLEQESGRCATRPPTWAPLCHAISRAMPQQEQAGANPPSSAPEQTRTLLACIRLFRAELERQQRFLAALDAQLRQQAGRLTLLEYGLSVGQPPANSAPEPQELPS